MVNNINFKEYTNCLNFYEPHIRPNRKPSQGDIILPYKGVYRGVYNAAEEYLIGKKIIGIIILTNKCDLEQNKAKYVTYCPLYKANRITSATNNKLKKKWKSIITLNHPYIFFIPPHSEIDTEYGGVIVFQDIRSENKKDFFNKYERPTLTLKRPYIDRLCSKVASFFNRIPIDHPEDNEINCWIEQCSKKEDS